jgi:hypothetical protein
MSDLPPIDPRVTEIVQAALDQSVRVRFEPGTYEGIDLSGDGIVRLDSQDPAEPGACHASIIGPQPNIGARVVVAHVPPMAAYIMGEVMIAPIGGEIQPRVLLDSPRGEINFYDPRGTLVGKLSAARWFAGVENGGSRAQLDPFGGLRIFDTHGLLSGVFDGNGIQIRDPDPTRGIVHANINDQGAVFTSDDGKQIHLIPSQTGTTVVPKWAGVVAQSPGGTVSTPLLVPFTPNDLELRYSVMYDDVGAVASSFTPPAGMTEVFDEVDNSGALSLGATLASLQPGTPGTGKSFTQSQAGMLFHNGHTMVVKANPSGSAPSIRSTARSFQTFNTERIEFSMTPPAGVVAGDLIIAFVAMANRGGWVPTTWSVPEGFQFSGAVFTDIGQTDTLASGVWYKVATASEPTSYGITIQVAGPPASTKRLHAALVAVQNPGVLDGGSDIRFEPQSACRVYATVNTGFPALNTGITVDFDQKSYDPGNNYNLGTNIYTVPASGPYKFGFQLYILAGAGEQFRANITKQPAGGGGFTEISGTGPVQAPVPLTPPAQVKLWCHDVQYFNQGDQISVDAVQNDGTLRGFEGGGSARSYFYIKRDLST